MEALRDSMIGKPIYDTEKGVASRKIVGYITKAWIVSDNLVEYEAEIDDEKKPECSCPPDCSCSWCYPT
jgi:hypothetical protein